MLTYIGIFSEDYYNLYIAYGLPTFSEVAEDFLSKHQQQSPFKLKMFENS